MDSTEKKSGDVESLDLIIVGAGISGINCAYRLQTKLPQVTFTIFENRTSIGGTWDLFKYPGIRSDSDLHTFGFSWHPWPHPSPIAEGDLIISYMKESVAAHGLDKYINFKHKVVSADWSSKTNRWTVAVENEGVTKRYTSRFMVLGAGYYDYNQPLKVEIPGLSNFRGKIIHPQFWPTDYDHTDKKIVVIGSGATAITLIPALAKTAAHVTMLQRSPSYIVSQPQQWSSPWTGPKWSHKIWPRSILGTIKRLYFMWTTHWFATLCRWFPKRMKEMVKKATLVQLPPRLKWDPHFSPAYYPWQQRLCLAPDGDFFKALHTPKADVVTGHIRTVTEDGIELTDGTKLDADVVVTATGLRMLFGGGIPLQVDGERIDTAKQILWNGAMVQDIPNLFYMIGYTNASWTLGSDETAFIICRLLKYMERKGIQVSVPRAPRDHQMKPRSSWQLTSTYVKAAEERFPKSGDQGPWRPRRHVPNDWAHARWGNITDGLHFTA
ncbi:hypothetical protein JX265_009943 [Neoarthrinium moseri]|uniref:FAD-containing monooxygenase EthA n=1 Tax=Neoarthrinium moseri TaxID=1658444 RepID=A0A9P9WFC9_9PEZI|nr:hypothetical protein JX266_012330 [Neoarthrinium moseri]KAI1860544.1 hypothetical protein JX265_009943 [Neoarthrinium moseri]